MSQHLKVALLGKGKTGSKVIELLGSENVTVFDTSNPLTLEKVTGHNVIISFLPGEPFVEMIDLLMASKIPVVTGSTGFIWPKDCEEKLKRLGTSWIWAHNFALGMNLIQNMIKVMAKANKLFDQYSFKIHEVHHTQKKDAPSGTALSWHHWLDNEADITSERTGDVIGEHEITLDTPFECIKLSHSAKDRKIFAAGSIWAAKKILDGTLEPGLHNFTDITLKELL